MDTPKPIITVGNTYSKFIIPSGLEYYYDPLLKKIDEDLSFPVQGREFMNLYNVVKDGERLWDGKKHLINLTGRPLSKVAWKQYITEPNVFLTGNIMRVIEACSYFGIEPEIIPSAEKIESKITEDHKIHCEWNPDFKEREYQRKCVDIAISSKRGLLQIATGGGKTIIAAKIIKEIGIKPVLFLVTTKDLLYQAYNSFNKSLNNPGVGIIGDGKCEVNNINVATIQSIMRAIGSPQEYNDSVKKLSDFIEDSFSKEKEIDKCDVEKIQTLLSESRMIIFDECQHAPADTCRLVIMRCNKAVCRFGMSATPFREDGEDLTIEGLFGRNLINISSSYLIDGGFLVKPQITMIDMGKINGRKKTYPEEYKTTIVENNVRNKIIAGWALAHQEKDRTVLILVKQIKHGKILEKLIPDSLFIEGKKSSKFRNQALEDLRERKLKVMIATSLADEGVDIPNLDVLILAGSGKSKTRALQRIGRVIRSSKDKKESFVIDFIDGGYHCRKHSIARKKIYKTEKHFSDIEIIRLQDMMENTTITSIDKGKGDIF